MPLPGVNINLLNNQLGRVQPTADGVAGLILTGIAVAGKINLLEPKQIFTTEDAKALGLDAQYDTANSLQVWRHISEFYAQAGEGSELWIVLVAETTTMADMADVSGNVAPALLDAADGRIRLLGITRVPDGTYTATYTAGLDDDVITAMGNAHALAQAYADLYAPVRVVVEGRDYQGVLGDLDDLHQQTNNRVQGIIGNTLADTSAAVGFLLGKYAGIAVQRNPGRVKDGDLNIQQAYLSDGNPIGDISAGEQDALHDKGWVFMRKYQGKAGFYFTDDPTAVALSDDYSSFARGRVIDKALVIAYTTYVEELLDDIEINPDTGQMPAAVVKSYQAAIENAININMTANGEISGVQCTIDPTQNVLATDKVAVTLLITPRGYSKHIEVDLGFSNPANS